MLEAVDSHESMAKPDNGELEDVEPVADSERAVRDAFVDEVRVDGDEVEAEGELFGGDDEVEDCEGG